uniref:BTB domain-containing protein n=1 Tax=Rhabditophanes sp. KR3021 TaxID=114890 RepID=A0AC35U3H8_9BILA
MIYQYFPNLFGARLFNDAELIFSDGSMKVSRMMLAGHSKFFFDVFTKDVTKIGGEYSKQSVVEIDIKQNSVKTLGSLSIGKGYHCSEKIGNDVFVLGELHTKKIEKYNLESNQSEVLSLEMTCNKDLYSSVLHSNRIYIIGGRLNGNSIDTVEYFEPEKMKWIDAPKSLQPIIRHDSVIVDQIIYVVGDCDSNKFQRYNLESNKSEVLSLEMTSNKYDYSSVVHSNRIYVIGGRLNNKSIDTVEYFEPEKMKWIDAPKLLQQMCAHDSVIVDEIIYAVGDYSSDKLQSFEPEKMKWIGAPKLLQQISAHDSVIVDEIIYAVGDFQSTKFQRFDPREGKWSFLADIPNKTFSTALSVFEHTITCSGGGDTSSLCQIYDIRNMKWNKLANLAIPAYGARSIENETCIIVAGGSNRENNDQIQSYKKYNKTWSNMDIKLPNKKHNSSKIWL